MPVREFFAEKLCCYLGYGKLLLGFRSGDGHHSAVDCRTRNVGRASDHADA